MHSFSSKVGREESLCLAILVSYYPWTEAPHRKGKLQEYLQLGYFNKNEKVTETQTELLNLACNICSVAYLLILIFSN